MTHFIAVCALTSPLKIHQEFFVNGGSILMIDSRKRCLEQIRSFIIYLATISKLVYQSILITKRGKLQHSVLSRFLSTPTPQILINPHTTDSYQPPHHIAALSGRPQHVATAHHRQNDTSVGALFLQTAAVSIIRISSVKDDCRMANR